MARKEKPEPTAQEIAQQKQNAKVSRDYQVSGSKSNPYEEGEPERQSVRKGRAGTMKAPVAPGGEEVAQRSETEAKQGKKLREPYERRRETQKQEREEKRAQRQKENPNKGKFIKQVKEDPYKPGMKAHVLGRVIPEKVARKLKMNKKPESTKYGGDEAYGFKETPMERMHRRTREEKRVEREERYEVEIRAEERKAYREKVEGMKVTEAHRRGRAQAVSEAKHTREGGRLRRGQGTIRKGGKFVEVQGATLGENWLTNVGLYTPPNVTPTRPRPPLREPEADTGSRLGAKEGPFSLDVKPELDGAGLAAAGVKSSEPHPLDFTRIDTGDRRKSQDIFKGSFLDLGPGKKGGDPWSGLMGGKARNDVLSSNPLLQLPKRKS